MVKIIINYNPKSLKLKSNTTRETDSIDHTKLKPSKKSYIYTPKCNLTMQQLINQLICRDSRPHTNNKHFTQCSSNVQQIRGQHGGICHKCKLVFTKDRSLRLHLERC